MTVKNGRVYYDGVIDGAGRVIDGRFRGFARRALTVDGDDNTMLRVDTYASEGTGIQLSGARNRPDGQRCGRLGGDAARGQPARW